MKKAVIFDMNGVLINDERVHQESWRQFASRYGFHISEEEFKKKVFGRTEKETFEFLFNKKLTEDEVSLYSNERVKIAIEMFTPQLKEIAGLKTFLQKLSAQNIPIGLATSSRRPYMNFILDGLGIRHFFQVIVTAEDITHGKPDPEIYLLAATQLHIAPKNCVVFEDSLSGITAAQKAHMKVVGITSTHSKEEINQADMLAKDFTEIELKNVEALFS